MTPGRQVWTCFNTKHGAVTFDIFWAHCFWSDNQWLILGSKIYQPASRWLDAIWSVCAVCMSLNAQVCAWVSPTSELYNVIQFDMWARIRRTLSPPRLFIWFNPCDCCSPIMYFWWVVSRCFISFNHIYRLSISHVDVAGTCSQLSGRRVQSLPGELFGRPGDPGWFFLPLEILRSAIFHDDFSRKRRIWSIWCWEYLRIVPSGYD